MQAEIAASDGNVLKDETQLVTFLLDQEEFGFDIMSVQEIIRLPQMAKVPKAAQYVDGIANLRGVVLPIIDMRTRFGMMRAEETDRTRVLVIDIDGVKTGLRVDRVRQVTRVHRSDVEPPPAAIRSSSADYLDGVVKLDGGKRIIMALDAARVCRGTGSQNGAAAQLGAGAGTRDGVLSASQDLQQMVTFRIGREEFAFPMETVREILRVQTPNQVPDAPDYLLGVLTVRGQILPIIDLRRLLQQPALADEVNAGCEDLAASYEGWRQLAMNGGCAATGAPQRVRDWAASFTTSSQALAETLTRIRAGNDRVAKLVHEGSVAAAAEAAAPIAELLRELGRQASANIQEDQRIIVVESCGQLLGLVVDHVNEVMNVARNLVDTPPELLRAGAVELSGIARLNDGGRLIMLLDVSRLMRDETLRELAEEASANVAHSRETSGRGAAEEDVQLVTFLLGTEEYGLPISQVQEIDRMSRITKIPKAPRFVEGITNLRGEVIPVLDARKRFDLEQKPADDRTRIIIVDLAGVKTGLIVDCVREVLSLSRSQVAQPPVSITSGVDQQFIAGIGKVDDGRRMIVLLNVEKILSREERRDLAGFSTPPEGSARE